MIRRLLSGITVVGLLLAVASPAVNAAPAGIQVKKKKGKKTVKAVVLSIAQIGPALIALNDMPTGWSQGPAHTFSPSATAGYCAGANADARAQNGGIVGEGYSSFSKDPNNGPEADGAQLPLARPRGGGRRTTS